jgi:threonine dehydrogenase-like Zn-dependent dehydrogenase
LPGRSGDGLWAKQLCQPCHRSAGSLCARARGVSPAAAAGLPVAFYTAWYALVELARLRAGETVLIHGGAGGVGLAATQIARALGATVISTVSSPDKAALARLYGATTSMTAAASTLSMKCATCMAARCRPQLALGRGDARLGQDAASRGRFIELGKRDYVANSLLALRPFRRNLSYFGVDVDQILALDPELTELGLKAIAEGFADGTYMPLPVTTYRAGQISEAFRLMQSAGHVGKIVVSAPQREGVPTLSAEPFKPGKGVQLIVGGTRGFGWPRRCGWQAKAPRRSWWRAARGLLTLRRCLWSSGCARRAWSSRSLRST